MFSGHRDTKSKTGDSPGFPGRMATLPTQLAFILDTGWHNEYMIVLILQSYVIQYFFYFCNFRQLL